MFVCAAGTEEVEIYTKTGGKDNFARKKTNPVILMLISGTPPAEKFLFLWDIFLNFIKQKIIK